MSLPDLSSVGPRLQAWLPWLVVLSVWCVFFLPVLARDRSFVFRDSGSFYRPLYEWTSRQWMEGRIPIWNDRLGIGTPVVGDATSALFYPGQIVFATPASAAFRLTLYVSLHAMLAGAGVYWLARSWQRSRWAAAFSAIAFTFGGSILFQQCNVVFLVGAAWLPWSIWCLSRSWRADHWGGMAIWMAAWSATLSMMVLGGDPQLAYHCVLLAGVGLLLRMWRGDTGEADSDVRRRLPLGVQLLRRPVAAVGGGVLLAVLLAAVQIGPSASWSRGSTRASRNGARSVYELAGDQFRATPLLRSNGAADLFTAPAEGHERQAYWFSVGPWRWMEYVLPNISGRMFEENRRWLKAVPAEGRAWSPSLYMGLPIVFFAVAGCSWRRRHQRWLILIGAISLLASMGWYGGGWFAGELIYMFTGKPGAPAGIGPQVGGVYWLFTTLLPGYAMFRYPAKWLTITSFAIALLGAFGWDRLMNSNDRWTGHFRATMIGLGGVSLVCGSLTAAFSGKLASWLEERVQVESFFGPFSGIGACQDIQFALMHCAGVALASAWLLRGPKPSLNRQLAMLLLAAVEITIANHWLAPSSPNSSWTSPTTLRSELSALRQRSGETEGEDSGPLLRVYRGSATGWLPTNWTKQTRDRRLDDALIWNVATGYPHLHLLPQQRLAIVNARSSIQSTRWDAWMTVGRTFGVKRQEGVSDSHSAALRPLGVRAVWLPQDVDWAQHSPGTQTGAHSANNLQTWREAEVWPRAWLVDELVQLDRIDDADRQAIFQRMQEIIRPDGRWRDLRQEAVIEEDLPTAVHLPADGDDRPNRNRVSLQEDESSRLLFDVKTVESQCLVLSNHFAPGWRCSVTTGGRRWEAEVIRVNGVMQGVALPAGRHRVEFIYRPTSLLWGAVISVVTWLSLAILSFFSTLRQSPAEDIETVA
jgi:hypothetical protein